MKKILFLILISFLLMSRNVKAQETGIGLRIGTPTAVTFKHFFDRNRTKAIEISLGVPSWFINYNFGAVYASNPRGVSLLVNGLRQFSLDRSDNFQLYFGPGLWIFTQPWCDKGALCTVNDFQTALFFAVEFAAGAEYTFPRVPISFFISRFFSRNIVHS